MSRVRKLSIICLLAGCGIVPASAGLARAQVLSPGSITATLDQHCPPGETTLCLNDDRFEVEVQWEPAGAPTGTELFADLPIDQLFDLIDSTDPLPPGIVVDPLIEAGGSLSHQSIFITPGNTSLSSTQHRLGVTAPVNNVINVISREQHILDVKAFETSPSMPVDGEGSNQPVEVTFEIDAMLDFRYVPETEGNARISTGFYLATSPEGLQPIDQYFNYNSDGFNFPNQLFSFSGFGDDGGVTTFGDAVTRQKTLTLNVGDRVYFDTYLFLEIDNLGSAAAQIDAFNTAGYELNVLTNGVTFALAPEPGSAAVFTMIGLTIMRRRRRAR